MIEERTEIYTGGPPEALLRIRKGVDRNDLENYDYRKDPDFVCIDDLTEEELAKLRALNSRLVEYEKQIKKQVLELMKIGLAKQNDPDDWISDFFECKVTMRFFLPEDDPDYEEFEDNEIMTMYDTFHDETIYGIADGQNHSDFRGENWKQHPLCNEHHCWTFHGLYDHTQLDWGEILRIDEIEVSIQMSLDHQLVPWHKEAS